MIAVAAYKPPTVEPPQRVDVDDRVLVPDGRVGTVIGFYRREVETVVVLFDSGESSEYIHADLHGIA